MVEHAAAAFSSLAFAQAGLLCIAVTMDRHRDIWATAASSAARRATWPSRLAGWALLALSLRQAIAAWGLASGAAAWPGVITAAALVSIAVLSCASALPIRSARDGEGQCPPNE